MTHRGPVVHLHPDDTLNEALRRFRRACQGAGVFHELRRREHYVSPAEKRREKAAAARKRSTRGHHRW